MKVLTGKFFFSVITALVFFTSLSCERKQQEKQIDYKELQEKLIEGNRRQSSLEHDSIDAVIARNGWEMEETGTGLHYMFLKSGSGEKAVEEQVVKINYKVFFLDGTLQYSSEKLGSRTFVLGRDIAESGLHEGVRMMRVGDQARFILPSYLAYGVTGDQEKIPSNTPIIYEVELIDVQ